MHNPRRITAFFCGDGVIWFRVLGYGFQIRDMRRNAFEVYADRLHKWPRIGPFRIKPLTPSL